MEPAFKIKGSLFTLKILSIDICNIQEIDSQLNIKINNNPQIFDKAPVVIDICNIEKDCTRSIIEELIITIKKHKFIIVGFRCSEPEKIKEYLVHENIFAFKGNQILSEINPESSSPKIKQNNPSTPIHNTKIITERVRTGQQVMSEDGDLIVIGAVSTGAEIVAKGNIHVYGTLGGRALAGIDGNMNACIFCQKLDADLVSIAGQYIILEDIPKGPEFENGYQIQLINDKIAIRAIGSQQ